jgi:hypothetical protein
MARRSSIKRMGRTVPKTAGGMTKAYGAKGRRASLKIMTQLSPTSTSMFTRPRSGALVSGQSGKSKVKVIGRQASYAGEGVDLTAGERALSNKVGQPRP